MCLTLCAGSSIHGILQARILEQVAISFSRGSSRPRDRTQVSHIAGRCFNLWAFREAQSEQKKRQYWKPLPMTNSKWCLSPHYSGHQVVFLFSRAEKGQRKSFSFPFLRCSPCGHEVIIIINFHKRLDLWPLGDFLLAHGSCHFAGIAINSSHQSMAVGSVWGAVINVLKQQELHVTSHLGPVLEWFISIYINR